MQKQQEFTFSRYFTRVNLFIPRELHSDQQLDACTDKRDPSDQIDIESATVVHTTDKVTEKSVDNLSERSSTIDIATEEKNVSDKSNERSADHVSEENITKESPTLEKNITDLGKRRNIKEKTTIDKNMIAVYSGASTKETVLCFISTASAYLILKTL
ncbi:hypothetical protein FQA39_LY12342 [Lamprigera yunnana]|nr:hypothetical protein FQA39_LY12342 [Lamprigera yunnana]